VMTIRTRMQNKMRYHEIASGLRIPVYSEEQDLLDRIDPKKGMIAKDELPEERDQELARLMVSRGVLNQIVKDGKMYYRQNSARDIWRER
jgi:hypothetical protein